MTPDSDTDTDAGTDRDPLRRRRLGLVLAALAFGLGLAGLVVGSDGYAPSVLLDPDARLIVGQIRAPRTLGAWLVGALLGLAGAVAQGLFRNPLADPYLLGSAAGATLAVVLVHAAVTLAGPALGFATAGALANLGLVGAAFLGALVGVLLTLMLSRGAQHTTRLLLGGVIVGVVLNALADLVMTVAPEALRGRQAFMLGSTGYLGWGGVLLLAAGLLPGLLVAMRLARGLDALTLGDDSATSLGVSLARLRLVLVAVFALATGLAVSQAGLIAFVGLVSPHLVRRCAPSPHGPLLLLSAAMGGTLLLAADVLARGIVAPQELPVGILTAVLGGGYLLWLLHRRGWSA